MSINYLRPNKFTTPVENKYSICGKISKQSIIIEEVIRKFNKNDISILIASIPKIEELDASSVVVRIGNTNKTIESEFSTGEIIQHIPGFISNYTLWCHFTCKANNDIEPNLPVCSTSTDAPHASVLIMKYITGGSVLHFRWDPHHYPLLKSITQQVIMSLLLAYHYHGFIHNDIHCNNILLQETNEKTITYTLPGNKSITIPLHGFKSVIMDFDSSLLTNPSTNTSHDYFLYSIQDLIARVSTELKNTNKERITFDCYSNTINFISSYLQKKSYTQKDKLYYFEVLHIIPYIENSNIQTPFLPQSYNPKKLGGRKSRRKLKT